MRVYFSPIFVFTEGFENITYSFENRIVTATYKGKKKRLISRVYLTVLFRK